MVTQDAAWTASRTCWIRVCCPTPAGFLGARNGIIRLTVGQGGDKM